MTIRRPLPHLGKRSSKIRELLRRRKEWVTLCFTIRLIIKCGPRVGQEGLWTTRIQRCRRSLLWRWTNLRAKCLQILSRSHPYSTLEPKICTQKLSIWEEAGAKKIIREPTHTERKTELWWRSRVAQGPRTVQNHPTIIHLPWTLVSQKIPTGQETPPTPWISIINWYLVAWQQPQLIQGINTTHLWEMTRSTTSQDQ